MHNNTGIEIGQAISVFYCRLAMVFGHAVSGDWLDKNMMRPSKAVHINPTKVTLYNDLGRILAGRGNIEDARIQFVKAFEIKPHLPATHFYLANVLVIQNQFNKAIYHFSEALRLHPDYSSFQSDTENYIRARLP